MKMASPLVAAALALATDSSSSQPPAGWSPLSELFAYGKGVALVEIGSVYSVANVSVLETRVIRCVRGAWPGHTVFIAGEPDAEPSEGQRWLVLFGSERHVSGTRAFWRGLDRLLDGRPLQASIGWLRVQELYGTPHVTFPSAELRLPPELEAQAVRLETASSYGGMLLLPLESLVPIIEAIPQAATDEEEPEEVGPPVPLRRSHIHR